MSNAGGRSIESFTENDIPQLRDVPVYANGEEIGHVGDIYYDDESQHVECVGIKGGWFGMKRQWIPAQGAVLQEDGLHVTYGRGDFDEAPRWDDEDLDEDRYGQVRGHFVRHEEEMQVGKQQVAAGSVRLRKWVETEPVETQVELQHETARVVREPVDEPIGRDTGAFEDQEVEVPLSSEEAVVGKQVVAKERVAVEKGVDTHTETVGDEVRKERVEVEGDGDVARR